MSSISLTLGLRGRLLSGTQTTLQGALFGNGEPGFTFEPWDITTLYQDRAGTTPVTAAGQSVGLRLDKSKGLALGAELVTNGDFATDTSWTKGTGCTISGGKAVMTAATGFFGQSLPSLVVGLYEFTVVVDSVSSGIVSVELGGAVGNDFSITSSGIYTFRRYWGGVDPTIYVNSKADPTTAVVDSVSLKLIAGNHQVAVSDAKRGVYGWMPKTGRRNLLTYTEQFDNAVWTKKDSTISVTQFLAPDGTTTADKVIPNSGAQTLSGVTRTFAAGVGYTYSIFAKAAEFSWLALETGNRDLTWFNLSAGVTGTTSANHIATISPAGNGWYRCSITVVTMYNGAPQAWVTSGNASQSVTGDGTSGILIWGAQLEIGSTATAYQRVVSQYDITEAGVPTCYYVQADGVDDAYVTPTITPNTDKAQVFAGVRRLVDTAGVIIEHSADWNSNNGTFLFLGGTGGSGTGAGFSSSSRGSAVATGEQFSAASNVALTPPVSAVVTALHDIAAPLSTSRANGFGGTSTAAKGTGNFLAYPLYIYSRGGTSLPFNGLDFGHAVRFGPNLDAATIARVEALIARNTPEVTL